MIQTTLFGISADFALISDIPTQGLTGIVRPNGTSLYSVNNNIATLSYAGSSADAAGVVYTSDSYGLQMSTGRISIAAASDAEISAKTNTYKPIVPAHLNYSIADSLTGINGINFTINSLTGLQSAIGISNASISFTSNGIVKGSITLNQSVNSVIDIGQNTTYSHLTYDQIYSDDTILTAYHDKSYFWNLQNQDATLFVEQIENVDYDIPIDINLSGSTVTLSGITRLGNLVDNFLNRCLITKRYDKTLLHIYALEHALVTTQEYIGIWTTTGTDSTTYAGAAGTYVETSTGHYENSNNYYIEIAGTNWRLFNGSGLAIAMGPGAEQQMEGAYGTVVESPTVGDSILTITIENVLR